MNSLFQYNVHVKQYIAQFFPEEYSIFIIFRTFLYTTENNLTENTIYYPLPRKWILYLRFYVFGESL